MGVPEQPAEQVARPGVAVAVGVGMCMCVCMCMAVAVAVGVLGATVVVAGLVLNLRVRGGGGAVPGAVPLAHEVRDAQHGRVEDQVPPARLGRPLGAGRVGAQGLAELGVEAVHGRRQVGGEGDKVARALLDAALRGGHLTLTWGVGERHKKKKRLLQKRCYSSWTPVIVIGDLMESLIAQSGCDRRREVGLICSKEVTKVCRRL